MIIIFKYGTHTPKNLFRSTNKKDDYELTLKLSVAFFLSYTPAYRS